MRGLKVEIFSEEVEYDVSNFDCGEEYLNTFLTDHLKRQHIGKFLRGYVLVTREEKPRVLGYYTLSGSCFEKEYFPSKTQQKRVPYKNVSSVTLARLAIDSSIQRQGYGETLVTHAMKVVYHASQAVGIHGMFVEALSDDAKKFYLGLGFILLKRENSNALFYPTKSIEELFEAQDE
ncbi:GNAT family N-acetyltransferase [Enterobacter roggenkampii]|uniref:GNAT family N-acetyltransferase n=1 Tax=Enterobacter roggenkampii TaxID=1812935 RepID=UPI002005BE0D|nr:GNAT family N-acetyltransferase [Enterobacter roggenkampii]MCK6911858.1 GNAT family N-acetyltransferase [Enterobacter roggenkampii]MEB6186351.1 GNAT family N-acetyltransferase [Enterobacter roggenkampii]